MSALGHHSSKCLSPTAEHCLSPSLRLFSLLVFTFFSPNEIKLAKKQTSPPPPLYFLLLSTKENTSKNIHPKTKEFLVFHFQKNMHMQGIVFVLKSLLSTFLKKSFPESMPSAP